MNDRFKFRTYHIPTKTMEYNGQWSGKDYDKKFNDCNFIVMQCIGLKDKNGKLIYEGDIVKSDFDFITNTINPLRFNIGNVIYSDYIAGFVIASDINDYSPYKTSFFGKTEALNCMVIGNIYENKELLESEG